MSSKRIRATGEVLSYLLTEFLKNHNPTFDQRKKISEKAGMSDKAVRIWFQNRRAKLRKSERKFINRVILISKSKNNFNFRNNDENLDFVSQNEYTDIDFVNKRKIDPNTSSNIKIKKNENFSKEVEVFDNEKIYHFIDCFSLSVGSWKKMKSGNLDENFIENKKMLNLSPLSIKFLMQNIDLLVIYSKKDLEINYFFSVSFNNSRILYRIFYPIFIIISSSIIKKENDNETIFKLTLACLPKYSKCLIDLDSNSDQWFMCDDFNDCQKTNKICNKKNTANHILISNKNSFEFLNFEIHQNSYKYLQLDYNLTSFDENLNKLNSDSSMLSKVNPNSFHLFLNDDNYKISKKKAQYLLSNFDNKWNTSTPSFQNEKIGKNNYPSNIDNSFNSLCSSSLLINPSNNQFFFNKNKSFQSSFNKQNELLSSKQQGFNKIQNNDKDLNNQNCLTKEKDCQNLNDLFFNQDSFFNKKVLNNNSKNSVHEKFSEQSNQKNIFLETCSNNTINDIFEEVFKNENDQVLYESINDNVLKSNNNDLKFQNINDSNMAIYDDNIYPLHKYPDNFTIDMSLNEKFFGSCKNITKTDYQNFDDTQQSSENKSNIFNFLKNDLSNLDFLANLREKNCYNVDKSFVSKNDESNESNVFFENSNT